MSETDELAQAVAKLLARHCGPEVVAAAKGSWSAALWPLLEEAGVPLAGVPEDAGGIGGGWPAAVAVLREAGRHAAPVPLAETILARMALAAGGLEIPAGPLTIAPVRTGERLEILGHSTVPALRGVATRVPWARATERIVVVAAYRDRDATAVVARPATVNPGTNLAAEPRDALRFVDVNLVGAIGDGWRLETLMLGGALARAAQMLGALERVLELTVEYARVREQFGRPIGQFQAIQQECARLAAEVAAAEAAVGGAATAMDGDDAAVEVAAAKVRVGIAASHGARIAHQVHGAIGVTEEHRLHHFTTRLWSWRDEFGGERRWSCVIGDAAASMGAEGLWDRLARTEVGT